MKTTYLLFVDWGSDSMLGRPLNLIHQVEMEVHSRLNNLQCPYKTLSSSKSSNDFHLYCKNAKKLSFFRKFWGKRYMLIERAYLEAISDLRINCEPKNSNFKDDVKSYFL